MDTRVDIASLKGTEGDLLDKFINAVLDLKKLPSKVTNSGTYSQPKNRYDDFVFMHIVSYASLDPSIMLAHRASTFLPWHRIYLRIFEKELQNIDKIKYGDVIIPYWDWTNPESTKKMFEVMGGNGREEDGKVMDGPFAYDNGEWELYTTKIPNDPEGHYERPFLTRKLGFYKTPDSIEEFDLPSNQDVLNSLNINEYDKPNWDNAETLVSFRNYLEGFTGPGLHNLVHGWVGGTEIAIRPSGERYRKYRGTMVLGVSPSDPIFFLHHSNIDRIWADWQLDEKHWNLPYKGYLPKEEVSFLSANDPMAPWYGDQTPAKAANFYLLGYKYDKYIRPHIKERETVIDETVSENMLSDFAHSREIFSDKVMSDINLEFLNKTRTDNLNKRLTEDLFPFKK
jgi:tyrosinase